MARTPSVVEFASELAKVGETWKFALRAAVAQHSSHAPHCSRWFSRLFYPAYNLETQKQFQKIHIFARLTYCQYISKEIQTVSFGIRNLINKKTKRDAANAVTHDRKGLIQRDVWRAPEVVLGAGWDAKADVWGMGCVIWRLINRRPLFYGRLPGSSGYTHEGHVAEMVAVMGSPPETFLSRAGEKESAEVFRPGTSILRSGLLPASCTLSSLIDLDLDAIDPEHGGEAGFSEFMGTMLRWEPEERLSAAEVAGLGWLDVE